MSPRGSTPRRYALNQHHACCLLSHALKPKLTWSLTQRQVLVRVVKAVSSTSRQRLIEIFLKASRLRFSRSRCVALSWLATLAPLHLIPSRYCSHALSVPEFAERVL